MRNIIFDLAGVVLNLNLERDTKALNGAGLPDFMGCLKDEKIRVPLLEYVNGLIEKPEFLRRMRPVCKLNVTDEEMLWAMDAVLDDIPKARLETIIRLREKYNVYLLSNIYVDAWQHAVREIERHGFTVEDCFDKTYLSYEMMLAKPDARIFEAVFKDAGIDPSETLYFDDSKDNIEAGLALGLQAHLVKMNCLEDNLKALGLLD